MTAKEAVERIGELLNLKFGKALQFATTKLEDGTEVTNNLDEEFKIGQELFIVGESTLTPAPSGKHTTREGLVITVDAESVIIAMEEKTTEAPANAESKPETEVKEEGMSEVEVDVPEVVGDVMTEDVIQAVVEALAPIVEEVKTLTEEMKKMKEMYGKYSSLEEDFNSFKKQPQRFSVTEVKKTFKESIDDYKLQVIKAMQK
jgi:hypothetical protein